MKEGLMLVPDVNVSREGDDGEKKGEGRAAYTVTWVTHHR